MCACARARGHARNARTQIVLVLTGRRLAFWRGFNAVRSLEALGFAHVFLLTNDEVRQLVCAGPAAKGTPTHAGVAPAGPLPLSPSCLQAQHFVRVG